MDGPDTPAALKARALRHLARREHSRAELARKLAPRAESPEALEHLLDALAAKKQLSDERYAELRAHQLARKYGTGRIRMELRAQGIVEEILKRVVAELAGAELLRATEIFRRKFKTPAVSAEEHARRSRFLRQRGFPHEIVCCVLGASSASQD